mgnify:CR=1 FL=1
MRDMRNEYLGQTNTDFGNMMNANAGMANANQVGFNMGNTASNNMVNAGGMFQRDDQNRMNDDRSRFEGNRDFASDKIGGFMSGIMGRAPTTPAPPLPMASPLPLFPSLQASVWHPTRLGLAPRRH